MHAPLSMVFFTTLTGAAQGLMLVLCGLQVAVAVGLIQVPATAFVAGAVLVLALGAVGLVAASFHLGHPWRGWRAMARWRSSWLSREVIALPAFLAAVGAWGLALALDAPALGWALLAAVLALLLYLCTGMIYAAIKAIPQWATPLTPLNYSLLGLASGGLLATAWAAFSVPQLVGVLGRLTFALTLGAAALRGATLWRNLKLVPKTTLQSAIGVRHPRIVPKAPAAMGGSFNTREFFHGRSREFVRGIRWTAALLGFALPAAVLAWGAVGVAPLALVLLFGVHFVGLLAERWSFFAEGQHTQNLYSGKPR
jgi:sulfite dehydrogenase (quinone) subunit SoeC